VTDLWIPIVLVAAALQTVRNAGQKHMAGQVSPWAAAWIRFGFGLPFTFLYLWWTTSWFGLELPPLAWSFWLPAVLGAVGQVTGTIFMVLLFRLRNFAVGSTYVRSEAILAAIVGTFLFAEPVSPAGWLAIIVSVAGVLAISMVRQDLTGLALIRSSLNASAGLGVLTGLAFAVSSFFIRQASLSFGHPNLMFTASITLVVVVAIQTAMLGAFILATRPREFLVLLRLWRPSLMVGAASAFGSMGWFTAMSLQRVAYVKALAQVEFIFALGVSYLFFGERSNRTELGGMALVAAGILILVLFAR
jgi:drug/metabolite transporter (DMT)-like permease